VGKYPSLHGIYNYSISIGDVARVEWQITPLVSGFYGITNRALVESSSLEVVQVQNRSTVIMNTSSNSISHRWMVTSLNTGCCRLTDKFLVPEFSLDTNNDAGVQLQLFTRAISNFSGQLWMLNSHGGTPDATLSSCQ